MKPRLIVIDGKTYNSVSEMPDDVRRQYEQAMSSFKDQDRNQIPDAIEDPGVLTDKNRNGIPDVMENTAGTSIISSAMKVLFDGREFNSIDELPPDARARYENAMGTLDKNRNGVPDFLEGMIAGASQDESHEARHSGNHTTHHAPRRPMPVTPTIEHDSPNFLLLALLAVLLFGACVVAAAGVWYFYLR